MNKSEEYLRGFQDAVIFANEIFESRVNAFYKRNWLRKKDSALVIAILDAMFRARGRMAEVGPRNMSLVLCRDGSFEFREKETKEKENA